MLNIITITSRFENLELLHKSIPEGSDISWHIVRSSHRKFNYKDFMEGAKIHTVNCKDKDTPSKINYVFDQIKGGYCCFLDDDTIFHPGMYELYKRYKGSEIGMVIGSQIDKDGNLRLSGSYPRECCIDSGNVLFHSSLLKIEQWGDEHWSEKFHADFDFYDRVFKVFGLPMTDVVPDVISNYNYLSHKPDTLDYLRK